MRAHPDPQGTMRGDISRGELYADECYPGFTRRRMDARPFLDAMRHPALANAVAPTEPTDWTETLEKSNNPRWHQ